jgi:hypothetical protein
MTNRPTAEKQRRKTNVIKAWAIINGASGFIYHHNFHKMLSIYADENEAKSNAVPADDEQVIPVEIRILPAKPKSKNK